MVLEKQLNDRRRIEWIRDEKNAEVTKNLEMSIKGMIEKEKFYDVIARLNKQPEGTFCKKKKEENVNEILKEVE
jgi:hypothetical protein